MATTPELVNVAVPVMDLDAVSGLEANAARCHGAAEADRCLEYTRNPLTTQGGSRYPPPPRRLQPVRGRAGTCLIALISPVG